MGIIRDVVHFMVVAVIFSVSVFIFVKTIDYWRPSRPDVIRPARLLQRTYIRYPHSELLTVWDVEGIGLIGCDDEEIFRLSKEQVMVKVSFTLSGPRIMEIVS